MEAKAKDLRTRSKEILSAVERGEEVVVTYRGKPTAKIVPYGNSNRKKKKENRNGHSLFGMWRDHTGVADVDEFIKTVRKKR